LNELLGAIRRRARPFAEEGESNVAPIGERELELIVLVEAN
jgi:hypothetical protein